MDVGSYLLFDKVIDLTFYTHTRTEDNRVGIWQTDDEIVQSVTYTSPDGKEYKKVTDTYKKDVVITCDNLGVKPDISLSFKAVPGRNVTQCELRITNLQLNSLRLKEWALVEITAGYRSSDASYGKTKLSVDIFSAWTESPNPDGVTVIQGIATSGALGMFFGPRKFYIQFNVEYITIRDLVTRLLNQEDVLSFPTFHEDIEVPFLNKKIGKVLDPDTGLIKQVDGTFGDIKIQMQNIRLTADSGYQVIQWIGRELYEWGKKYGWYIITNIFNDRIKISCTTSDSDGGEDAVELTVIDSAAFTGGTLTVKAPWAPSLIPGGLFKINPQYFSLQNTYRLVDPSIYTDADNTYRCITMEVSFDTNGNNNQMTIFAIPFRLAQSPWDSYTDASINYLSEKDQANNINIEQWTQKKQMSSLMTTILFGPSDEETEGAVEQGSLWSKLENTSISNMNARVIEMDALVNNESLTAVNWYRTYHDTMYPQGRGCVADKNDPKKSRVGYPVLFRSELKQITDAIKSDNADISLRMKNRLLMSRTFELKPDTLWILYPVFAYIQSCDHGGKLAALMSKDTIGGLLNSPFNIITENSSHSARNTVSAVNGEAMDSYTVKPADVEKTNVVYIPDVSPIKDTTEKYMKAPSDGGNRDSWSQFKGFTDAMKYIIDDKTMKKSNPENFDWDMFIVWYYYLREVA